MATANDPSVVSIKGRLSYPVWDHAAAVARNAKSKFPETDPQKVRAEFNLLLTEEMQKVLVDHLINEFLPFTQKRKASGETKNALEAKDAQRLIELLEKGVATGEWASLQPPYIPIKDVPDATKPLAPECVAAVKIVGAQGQSITRKAVVTEQSQLLPAYEHNWIGNKGIFDINMTTHEMFAGAYVAATLNLYAFMSGKVPGLQASASTAIFLAKADRFGGGVDMDEDSIFAFED